MAELTKSEMQEFKNRILKIINDEKIGYKAPEICLDALNEWWNAKRDVNSVIPPSVFCLKALPLIEY